MLSDVIERYGGKKIDPLDVYKDIFRIGEGFIQKEYEKGGFKANPIAKKHPEGRPDKQKIVQKWKSEHPKGKKADCIRDTGLDKKTVYKWWEENKNVKKSNQNKVPRGHFIPQNIIKTRSDSDTEALIREARAGINSSRTREENSGADRANREAERSRQRAEAQRRAEEAKREAEARQAQRRARSRSYGIER